MKRPEHIKRAKEIGDDSWELLNFTQLPKNASAKRQVEALRRDKKWIENHCETISWCIDEVISDIERKAESR